jgi:hypothetical protein
MRVETQVSLKGTEGGKAITWLAGTVFDDTKAPLPTSIKQEIQRRSGTVMILPELAAATQPDVESEPDAEQPATKPGIEKPKIKLKVK